MLQWPDNIGAFNQLESIRVTLSPYLVFGFQGLPGT